MMTWIGTVGDPYGHGVMHIADVRGWGHLTGRGACALDEAPAIAIQTANAHLIAGAPDLHEAAVAAVELIELWMDGIIAKAGITWESPADHPPALIALRAAIARAEGAQ